MSLHIPGSVVRGARNPFRSKTRATVVVLLLSFVIGLVALMVQATLASRQQISKMESRVQTLIEMRPAGSFGSSAAGAIGPVEFSSQTLEAVRKIPHAKHIVRTEEYVYHPHVDATKKHPYAMVIGLQPESTLRSIGEVDYENARVIAGRPLRSSDAATPVALVGKLYAQQRLGIDTPSDAAVAGKKITVDGHSLEVIGIFSTGTHYGDNQVFVPIEPFRTLFKPGERLSKIFVTVDSVVNVEKVVRELRRPEADVITEPEAISTARTTLGSLALVSTYAAGMLFVIGVVLVVFVMVLSTRERIREIGTLKALGGSNKEIVSQFLTESLVLSAMGAVGAFVLAVPLSHLTSAALKLSVSLDGQVAAFILVGATVFAAIGSLYPVIRGMALSPINAIRRNV